MSYQIVNDLRANMPGTNKNSLPYKLIACHDTEGGQGLVGARGTIAFFLSTLQRNASYHELWSWDANADVFTVTRIVPSSKCAHSLNPFPPAYNPDAWVRAALGSKGVSDPNQGVYAVSIAGRVADVNRYAQDARFIAHCKRRIGELRRALPSLVGLAEHFRFQPGDRTDWGTQLTAKLGGLSFAEAHIPTAEVDMIIRTPTVTEQWTTRPGAAFTRADGSKANFTVSEKVTSHAELTMADGSDARLLDYGSKHESLIIGRAGLIPIPGTRIVGLPTGTGFTQVELDAAIKVTKQRAIKAVEAI